MAVLRKSLWLWWVGCGALVWLGVSTDAQAQWLLRHDISLYNINQTWKQVRALLAKHNHPKSRALLQKWHSMSVPSQPIVPFAPSGHLIPDWLADARRGSIFINTTYLKSLRRQFNSAVQRSRQRIYETADLDLVGAWGNVWQGLALEQHRRAKLRLLFALKLLPGFEYTRCRAHLQGMLQRRHGVFFSEETVEVALLCLRHKREVYRAISRHPILKRVWNLVYWSHTDLPVKRLQGTRAALPSHHAKSPKWRAACRNEGLRLLVASAYFAMRRYTCSFCPAYSMNPTMSSIWIRLVRRGERFTINREHYRSLLFGVKGELLFLLRKQWHYHAYYNNTFLRRLRAKGARFMSERKQFERNLMVDQVRHYNWLVRENLRSLLQGWTRETIQRFYKKRFKQSFPLHKHIPACIRATEYEWLQHATTYLFEWIHP